MLPRLQYACAYQARQKAKNAEKGANVIRECVRCAVYTA